MAISLSLNKKKKKEKLKRENKKFSNVNTRTNTLKAKRKINQQRFSVIKKTRLMKMTNLKLLQKDNQVLRKQRRIKVGL